jgi:WD40 repeat protein
MGVVYKARQTQLGRMVALKMILSGGMAGEEELARFRTEAEAIARLQHANIVQIHEVGEHDGRPFFSLEFCSGGSLADKLNGTPLPAEEAARLLETLAQAMEAAHQAHVIHRDLKPANVLLAADGTPKITDFGLAKKLDMPGQTHTGAVMGTPSYMAPEQAGGHKDVGPAADVYSLGAILYELLTGRPPFKGASAWDTMQMVIGTEPVAPRQLQPKVPRDLETICLKCLQKQPSRRYASAAALADDLRRFLAGEPILAHPVGRWERGWRWCRRNPMVASLTALVAMVLLASSLVSWGLMAWALGEKHRADEQANKALQQKQQADDSRDLAELRLYASKLAHAQRAWQDNDMLTANQLLEESCKDLRGIEYRILWTMFNRNPRTLKAHKSPVQRVCISADGKRMLISGNDSTVRVWDDEKGRELLTIKGLRIDFRLVCLSADGKRIVSTGGSTIKVWDADNGLELLTIKGHPHHIDGVGFSANGKRILSWTNGDFSIVKVWDADNGQELTLNNYKRRGSFSFSWLSADGKHIFDRSDHGMVRAWDADNGQELLTLTGDRGIYSISADGKRIVSSGNDGSVRVWDAETGRELLTIKGLRIDFKWVCLSADGKRIVISNGGTVEVWDVDKRQELHSLRIGINSICLSADGNRIVIGSGDGTVKVLDVTKKNLPFTFQVHTGRETGICISAEGRYIVTGGNDNTAVKVWDAENGKEILSLKGHTGTVTSVCVSVDGKRIISGSDDTTVKVWDAEKGQDLLTLTGHKSALRSVCLSADGTRIVSGSNDGWVRLWDAKTGRELLTLNSGTFGCKSVCLSDDGKRIVSSHNGVHRVMVWDVDTGEKIQELNKGAYPSNVCFSADGKRVVCGSHRTVKVWDAETGQELLALTGHLDLVTSVCLSADGKRIVSGSDDKTVKIWDAEKGQELLTLTGHTSSVTFVAFSLDGQRLTSASQDGIVRVWEASPISEEPGDSDDL